MAIPSGPVNTKGRLRFFGAMTRTLRLNKDWNIMITCDREDDEASHVAPFSLLAVFTKAYNRRSQRYWIDLENEDEQSQTSRMKEVKNWVKERITIVQSFNLSMAKGCATLFMWPVHVSLWGLLQCSSLMLWYSTKSWKSRSWPIWPNLYVRMENPAWEVTANTGILLPLVKRIRKELPEKTSGHGQATLGKKWC